MSFVQVALGSRPLASAPVGMPHGRHHGVEAIPGWHDDLEMAALRLVYAEFGGIARGEDIGRLLADHGPSTFISVAQLLADREIFGFDWQSSLWIPMFQFRLADLSINACARHVREQLGDGFDGWALSAWFLESNLWLGGRRPIELMDSHLDAVLHAARADRFVATG